MSEEKNVFRVYDIVCTIKGDDGCQKVEFHEYGFRGSIPSYIVDCGGYLDLGDGSLNLMADDGNDIRTICDIADGWAHFSSAKFDKYCSELVPGEWVEWTHEENGEPKATIRVTALSEMPKISPEKTIANSDLSVMQKSKISIYGKPLFNVGDVCGRTCLRPRIAFEANDIWTEYVRSRCGECVEVLVDESDFSADYVSKRVTINAPSISALHSAMRALGVFQPEKIPVDYTAGRGDAVKLVSAGFWLSECID